MQSVRIAIDIDTKDIPNLVCNGEQEDKFAYESVISKTLAEALGLQEFLHCPERVNEVRRIIWEKDQRSEF